MTPTKAPATGGAEATLKRIDYIEEEAENIQFSMFATNWYLTIFSSSFPFDVVTRVWDSFLAEGYKVRKKVLGHE